MDRAADHVCHDDIAGIDRPGVSLAREPLDPRAERRQRGIPPEVGGRAGQRLDERPPIRAASPERASREATIRSASTVEAVEERAVRELPRSSAAAMPRGCQTGSVARDLEHDLKALADRARDDRDFAGELYAGLCNADWTHDDATEWSGSWRSAAGVVAQLRGRGEDYLDFYCAGGEGEITDRVADALAHLGWHGVGHGASLRRIDFSTGEVKVLGADGEWVTERSASG
jgi:hypothetical protein